jgi:hypothetical protein
MGVEMSYAVLKERHPSEMEQLERQIKAAPLGYTRRRIPIRNYPITDFRFSYSYGWTGASMMGGEFMRKMQSGELDRENAEREQWENTATIDEKVNRRFADHIRSVSISAHLQGSSRTFAVHFPDGFYPPEVVAHELAAVEREDAERRRRNAQSPEERNRESAEILRELGGSPGFVGVHMQRSAPQSEGVSINFAPGAYEEQAHAQADFVDQFCDYLDATPGLSALLSMNGDENLSQGLREVNDNMRRKSGMPVPERKKPEPETTKPERKRADRFSDIY